MTRKEKAKKQAKEYKIKKSAMLKQQASEDINERFSAETEWEKKKDSKW